MRTFLTFIDWLLREGIGTTDASISNSSPSSGSNPNLTTSHWEVIPVDDVKVLMSKPSRRWAFRLPNSPCDVGPLATCIHHLSHYHTYAPFVVEQLNSSSLKQNGCLRISINIGSTYWWGWVCWFSRRLGHAGQVMNGLGGTIWPRVWFRANGSMVSSLT